MSNTKNKLTKNDIRFFIGLGIFSVVACIYYFAHEMSEFNTSLFALSYKYGFISRGIVGTFWQWLDKVLPFDLMNYYSIYNTNILITALFFIFIFILGILAVKCVSIENKNTIKYLLVFFMIFTIPTYVTRQNMGRIDIYLIMISMICVFLLVLEKVEWLIIPLCGLAMSIHQGFVFTNVNIVLVLILYKALKSNNKKKYYVLFGLTFVLVSVLFLYFEFARNNVSIEAYNEMVENAKNISPNGDYYKMLFKHELLGQDVYEDESFWHLQNRVEFPIFVVLCLPYVLMAIQFFVSLLKGLKNRNDMVAYWLVLLGSLTLLPEWILKVDYGRYVYNTVFYYVVICIALICMKDNLISAKLNNMKMRLKEISSFTIILVIYPLIFMPLYDTEISRLTYNILRIVGFRE